MIKQIKFISKAAAETIHPVPANAMISIVEPMEERTVREGWDNLLKLEFHDTSISHSEHSTELGHWSLLPVAKGEYVYFNDNQAKLIINFVEALPLYVETLFVHCHAGISRSAAVAKFLTEIYNLEFDSTYDRYNKHVYKTLIDTFYNDLYSHYDGYDRARDFSGDLYGNSFDRDIFGLDKNDH